MSFLFGRRTKSPAELVRLTNESIQALERQRDERASQKALQDITKYLSQMKIICYGDGEKDPNQEETILLAQEVYVQDLLPELITHIRVFEFEARKDVAQIFNFLLRRQTQNQPTVQYVAEHPVILESLVQGYEESEIALNCGSMLRECIRHEPLCRMLLYSPQFRLFFVYVEMQNFDIASDAFATFKELLTKHKATDAEFLETNYDEVFTLYNSLLGSVNYVTRRQSLKLLGELLLDRSNFNIMMRYINNADNLKLMMNLLRDKSKSIQFEAFHVFKVFVANPRKTRPVVDILLKNKEKLITYLTRFHSDKAAQDEVFNEEKTLLLNTLSQLDESSLQSAPEPEQAEQKTT